MGQIEKEVIRAPLFKFSKAFNIVCLFVWWNELDMPHGSRALYEDNWPVSLENMVQDKVKGSKHTDIHILEQNTSAMRN